MDDADFLARQNKLISLCPEVNTILYTLNKYLGVTFFRYVKSYPNGEKYILTNNEQWLENYFKEKFYNTELADYAKHPEGSRGVHIHHECDKDHPVCNFWNKNGKIGNYNCKIAFFIKFKEYFEMFDFALIGDKHTTNDTFFNNQKVFRHFFLYFKSRGQDIFKQAELAKFPIDTPANYDLKQNWLLGLNSQTAKLILEEMPLREFYLDDEFANVALTLEEARSLQFFIEGHNFNQALEKIGITQESHVEKLASVMNKVEVKSYNDLRALCQQKNIAKKLSFLDSKVRF
jgi:hypothetical protein